MKDPRRLRRGFFIEYGVPHIDWATAFFFYSRQRVEEEFGLLDDVFSKMPKEKRPEAFNLLNACVAYGSGKTLAEFSGLKEKPLQL